MESQKEYYSRLQEHPSQLNPDQELEIAEMEERNKYGNIAPTLKERLRAFQRMKYHP